MKGRELEPEKLQDIEDENNVSGIIDQKPVTIIEPTIQNGQNEDGTIREIKLEDVAIDYSDLPSNYLINSAVKNSNKDLKK